ncbi:hypothetical protein PC9H_009775 [Pleurotus ostreatus]|uniref:Uncharacterized protein n=2 Tax=Pleurotus TaxID=5320 RepID=A0A8H7DQZ7_PLEOS|nr:uncharacterized protein PC9H_009775 [Pleurotus ostreatus]KAF7424468.1 hypothetical protein PC9H_009775 [Pleurotus ostreatus]KAG9224904.1 hypothetical protein CCMSSC00406_0001945 [Pleurotus cornucopiae]
MDFQVNSLNENESHEEPKGTVHDWAELSNPNYAIPPLVEGVPDATSVSDDGETVEDKPFLDYQDDYTALDSTEPKPLVPTATVAWLYGYLPTVDKSLWSDLILSMARNCLAYLLEIVECAAQMMKGPMSYLVFFWMMLEVTKKATPILLEALPPICVLPGTSLLPACRSESLSTGSTISKGLRGMDFPKIFDIQKKTFDHLADQSASFGGSGLSLDLKKVEMASKDLVTLVKVSDMKSRDDIARTMTTFVRNAQSTGRGLSKFNAKMGGAMDRHASSLAISFTLTNVFSF